MKISKIFIFLIIFAFFSTATSLIFAEEYEVDEEETDLETGELIEIEEEVTEEDLGLGKQTLLPGNPFYFVKDWRRGIQSFFTFNSVKKAELKLKFSNEKLMELKEMVRLEKKSEDIENCTEKYKEEVERIKEQAERIKEKAKDNPNVDKFLQKYSDHQILHQKLLEKLENQVSPEAFGKIKEAREKHLERFGEVMTNLEDRAEKIEEKLNESTERARGSKYKNFKNLEILKELGEKIPEKAREAVRNAEGNALKRLQGDLEKMSSEDQEKFKEYLNEVSGDKEGHLEILENLRQEVNMATTSAKLLKLKEKLGEGREGIMERIENQKREENCPVMEKPAIDFCKDGRIIIERDENGCPLRFECIVPAESESLKRESPSFIPNGPSLRKPDSYCISLWDPVCGDDGKTYSNSCWAGVAGVNVKHKGVCSGRKNILPNSTSTSVTPTPRRIQNHQ